MFNPAEIIPPTTTFEVPPEEAMLALAKEKRRIEYNQRHQNGFLWTTYKDTTGKKRRTFSANKKASNKEEIAQKLPVIQGALNKMYQHYGVPDEVLKLADKSQLGRFAPVASGWKAYSAPGYLSEGHPFYGRRGLTDMLIMSMALNPHPFCHHDHYCRGNSNFGSNWGEGALYAAAAIATATVAVGVPVLLHEVWRRYKPGGVHDRRLERVAELNKQVRSASSFNPSNLHPARFSSTQPVGQHRPSQRR